MGLREDLHDMLEEALGSTSVHFQPPTSLSLVYPCIIYSLADIETKFANNKPYINEKKYTITFMHREPDSSVVDKIVALEKCLFDRRFVVNNLYHDVFNIFF